MSLVIRILNDAVDAFNTQYGDELENTRPSIVRTLFIAYLKDEL